jgi:glycosyltransferase involved in cell wall biosynthesis
LLEAAALGVPTAAMVTGGTRDIVSSGETGLLSTSPEELGDDVRRLGVNTELRRRLGQAARRRVEERFAAPVVVRRIEALYEELLARVEAGAAR